MQLWKSFNQNETNLRLNVKSVVAWRKFAGKRLKRRTTLRNVEKVKGLTFSYAPNMSRLSSGADDGLTSNKDHIFKIRHCK